MNQDKKHIVKTFLFSCLENQDKTGNHDQDNISCLDGTLSFWDIWNKECTLISQEPTPNEKTTFAMNSRPYTDSMRKVMENVL